PNIFQMKREDPISCVDSAYFTQSVAGRTHSLRDWPQERHRVVHPWHVFPCIFLFPVSVPVRRESALAQPGFTTRTYSPGNCYGDTSDGAPIINSSARCSSGTA